MPILTEQDAIKSVLEWPFAIQFVPDHLKTPDVCHVAVDKDGWMLLYLPDELKTPDLCRLSILDDPLLLEYIPNHLKTTELCLIAVQLNGLALKYAPLETVYPTKKTSLTCKHYQTCLTAVCSNPLAFQYVPEYNRTKHLITIAVSRHPPNYVLVKDPDITTSILAVSLDINNLKYIPTSHKDLKAIQTLSNTPYKEYNQHATYSRTHLSRPALSLHPR